MTRIRRNAMLIIAMYVIAGCAPADVNDSAAIENGSFEDAPPQSTLTLDELQSAFLVDGSGELRGEIDDVNVPIVEWAGRRVASVEELAQRSDAAIIGTAGAREQDTEYSTMPLTLQTFSVDRVIAGDVGDQVTLAVMGGVVEEAGLTVLMEPEHGPQYEPGAQYLLFLVQVPEEDEALWWSYGPDLGRYKLDGDAIVADYTDDILDPEYEGPNARGSDRGDGQSGYVDQLGLIGQTVDDVIDVAASEFDD